MSEGPREPVAADSAGEEPEAPKPGGYAPSPAARLAFYERAGGVATPLVTTLLAFFVGGLVVLVISGKNPLSTYREIFNGTGLNWLLPWTCDYGSDLATCRAAGNLQQTLIQF